MSAPTATQRTAALITYVKGLLATMPEISGTEENPVEIPVVSGHDTFDLAARIAKATGSVKPGLIVLVAVTGGKPQSDERARARKPWTVTLQVDVSASPLIQSAGPAAVDLMDAICDFLQGKPSKAGEISPDARLNATSWGLSSGQSAEGKDLLTYSIIFDTTIL